MGYRCLTALVFNDNNKNTNMLKLHCSQTLSDAGDSIFFYLSNLAIIIGVHNVTIQVFTFQSNSRDDFGLLGVQCAEPPSAFHLGGGK